MKSLNFGNFFYGKAVLQGTQSPGNPNVEHFGSMDAFLMEWYFAASTDHVDIVDIRGGEQRVTQLLVRRLHRRGFRLGQNFYLRVGIGLLNPVDRHWVWFTSMFANPSS